MKLNFLGDTVCCLEVDPPQFWIGFYHLVVEPAQIAGHLQQSAALDGMTKALAPTENNALLMVGGGINWCQYIIKRCTYHCSSIFIYVFRIFHYRPSIWETLETPHFPKKTHSCCGEHDIEALDVTVSWCFGGHAGAVPQERTQWCCQMSTKPCRC
jgi:hypothetical protein